MENTDILILNKIEEMRSELLALERLVVAIATALERNWMPSPPFDSALENLRYKIFMRENPQKT